MTYRTPLSDEFLKNIRISNSYSKFIFESFDTEIVPEKFEHKFLLDNFKVNDNILNEYYKPSSDLFTDKEFEALKKDGYLGRKLTYTKPYSIKIYGAFFLRKSLLVKLTYLGKNTYIDNKQVKYFEDFKPYFKEYAKGFKNGFESFEDDCINAYQFVSNENERLQKVFDFVTKVVVSGIGWKVQAIGFTLKIIDNDIYKGEIINGFEDGKINGYFYKAWSIIFSNNNLFKPLFDKYYEDVAENDSNDTEKQNTRNTKDFESGQAFEVALVCIEKNLWLKKETKTYKDLASTFFKSKDNKDSYEAVLKQIISNQTHSNNFLQNNEKIKIIIEHCKINKIVFAENIKDVFNLNIGENNKRNPKIRLELL